MRCLLTVLLILCAAPVVAGDARSSEADIRILFVGNSLTYVGNLPRVVEGLAAASGRSVYTDMIASGGATLTMHAAESATRKAITDGSYDYVVLQERGGDVMCSFGSSSCVDARQALAELSKLAMEAGAKVIYLGTYQYNEVASERLAAAETKLAAELGIAHLQVSERFRHGVQSVPDANWLASDGMHPGADLTLLMAILIHRHIFESLPTTAFTVEGEMREPGTTGSSVRGYSSGRVGEVISVVHM